MALRQQQQALLNQLNRAQATTSNSGGSVIGSSPDLDQPAAVEAVSVKLPDFYHSDPALWFARAECIFSHGGITAQWTKFDYVAAALSEQFSIEVRELLISPPQTEPYTTLKSQLIARTQMSEQKRLRRLLTEEELGDRTPSHLLRRMQQLIRFLSTLMASRKQPSLRHSAFTSSSVCRSVCAMQVRHCNASSAKYCRASPSTSFTWMTC